MIDKVTDISNLPPRAKDAHKGTFGKVLIIAGSRGMTGAAAIAGKSALRSGAGLVRVATPKSVLPIVASIEPCFTTIGLADHPDSRVSLSVCLCDAACVVGGAVINYDNIKRGVGLVEHALKGIGEGFRGVISRDDHGNGGRLHISFPTLFLSRSCREAP